MYCKWPEILGEHQWFYVGTELRPLFHMLLLQKAWTCTGVKTTANFSDLKHINSDGSFNVLPPTAASV